MSTTLSRSPGTSPVRTRAALWRTGPVAVQLCVFVLAVAARLVVIVRHGGLRGNFGYDAGVYFAAGDAFVRGRLPYRDFTLIHPPVEMLVLSPFAEMTRMMSDGSAFTVTVLAFTILGGVNAVLVARVAQRMGLGLRSALVAATFYALWFGSVGSEYLIKLEPVGNLFFLLALLAGLRALRGGGSRLGTTPWAAAAGALAGVCVSVKIWWIVPVLGVVAWLAWRTRSRTVVAAVLAGAVGASVAIDGPFFAASPRAMWSSVVLDQVSRGAVAPSPLKRLSDLSSVSRVTGPMSHTTMAVTSVAVLVVAAWVAHRAWAARAARPVVVLATVQGILLLAAPSWFPYYADFIAVAAALTVGAAAGRSRRWRFDVLRPGWVVTAGAAAVTVTALANGHNAVQPFPGGPSLTRAASGARCVMSDSPMALIRLDALSRGLRSGCRNWVDVTGRTYGPDRSALRRVDNLRWQRDLTAYLRSGDAVIILRGAGTGVSPATYRALHQDGVLGRAGGYTLYRVRPGA